MSKNPGWRCDECRYFVYDESEGDGWCRRHAPRTESLHRVPSVEHDEPTPLRTFWPVVQVDDWCGEFHP